MINDSPRTVDKATNNRINRGRIPTKQILATGTIRNNRKKIRLRQKKRIHLLLQRISKTLLVTTARKSERRIQNKTFRRRINLRRWIRTTSDNATPARTSQSKDKKLVSKKKVPDRIKVNVVTNKEANLDEAWKKEKMETNAALMMLLARMRKLARQATNPAVSPVLRMTRKEWPS